MVFNWSFWAFRRGSMRPRRQGELSQGPLEEFLSFDCNEPVGGLACALAPPQNAKPKTSEQRALLLKASPAHFVIRTVRRWPLGWTDLLGAKTVVAIYSAHNHR